MNGCHLSPKVARVDMFASCCYSRKNQHLSRILDYSSQSPPRSFKIVVSSHDSHSHRQSYIGLIRVQVWQHHKIIPCAELTSTAVT